MFQRVFVVGLVLVLTGLVAAQSPSGPAKPLPPGPMQAKVKAACTQCHNTARIAEKRRTREEWSNELDKMIGLGAEVPDSERAGFLNYLTKNFGPAKSAKTAEKKSAVEAK